MRDSHEINDPAFVMANENIGSCLHELHREINSLLVELEFHPLELGVIEFRTVTERRTNDSDAEVKRDVFSVNFPLYPIGTNRQTGLPDFQEPPASMDVHSFGILVTALYSYQRQIFDRAMKVAGMMELLRTNCPNIFDAKFGFTRAEYDNHMAKFQVNKDNHLQAFLMAKKVAEEVVQKSIQKATNEDDTVDVSADDFNAEYVRTMLNERRNMMMQRLPHWTLSNPAYSDTDQEENKALKELQDNLWARAVSPPAIYNEEDERDDLTEAQRKQMFPPLDDNDKDVADAKRKLQELTKASMSISEPLIDSLKNLNNEFRAFAGRLRKGAEDFELKSRQEDVNGPPVINTGDDELEREDELDLSEDVNAPPPLLPHVDTPRPTSQDSSEQSSWATLALKLAATGLLTKQTSIWRPSRPGDDGIRNRPWKVPYTTDLSDSTEVVERKI